MWEYLTAISTIILNKENIMMLLVLIIALPLVGAGALLGYLNYTGSVINWKKVK